MVKETLFYKDHVINNNDVEIFFHKDYTYLFNETTSFPIVKFTLIDCKNLSDIQFDNIDQNNDGITVDSLKNSNRTTFLLTDINGIETKLFCDKIIRNDLGYRTSDLIDIIQSIQKESNENDERATMLDYRIQSLAKTLTHDLDIIQRKLEQANWLTVEKKQFLEGQQIVVKQVLQILDKNYFKIPNQDQEPK